LKVSASPIKPCGFRCWSRSPCAIYHC
jgi:hypothetical protein